MPVSDSGGLTSGSVLIEPALNRQGQFVFQSELLRMIDKRPERPLRR